MGKRRILIIQESLKVGGAEKVLIDILNQFDYEKYQVDLLLLYKKGVHIVNVNPNVTVLNVNVEKKPFIERVLFRIKPLLDIYQRRRIKSALCGREYDVIVSFLEGDAAKSHSLISSMSPRNITWVHTNMETNAWDKIYWKSHAQKQSFYESMDKVVCVSYDAEKSLGLTLGDKCRTIVINNIIDRDAILRKASEYEVEKRKFTIVHVGRMVPVKRQDLILDAALLLKQRGFDVEFWIVGDGVLRAELEKKSGNMGLCDTVKFMGYQANPYPYIKSSDLFLLTSDAEGDPLVIKESLCLGTPCVSTNVGYVSELLRDGLGIICEHNPDDIANKLLRIMTNSAELESSEVILQNKSEELDPQRTMKLIYELM